MIKMTCLTCSSLARQNANLRAEVKRLKQALADALERWGKVKTMPRIFVKEKLK